MSINRSVAVSSPNIAFIKYWGNKDERLRIPSNDSLSLTLGGLETKTKALLLDTGANDELILNGDRVGGEGLERVSNFLSLVRSLASREEGVRVSSSNNFPAGAGIASSAAGFSALALAASKAFSLDLSPTELSRLARRGSGSAARSIFGGYVELKTGETDKDSFAAQFLPGDHWQLEDCIAVIDKRHKPVGSSQGHLLAKSSPIQSARVNDTPRRLERCKQAIIERDFLTFADIVEQDSNLMHAVMLTSTPSLLYLAPATLQIMQSVTTWRREEGVEACFTIDAGPNVHVVCTAAHSAEVHRRLNMIEAVQEIIHARPGPGVREVN